MNKAIPKMPKWLKVQRKTCIKTLKQMNPIKNFYFLKVWELIEKLGGILKIINCDTSACFPILSNKVLCMVLFGYCLTVVLIVTLVSLVRSNDAVDEKFLNLDFLDDPVEEDDTTSKDNPVENDSQSNMNSDAPKNLNKGKYLICKCL